MGLRNETVRGRVSQLVYCSLAWGEEEGGGGGGVIRKNRKAEQSMYKVLTCYGCSRVIFRKSDHGSVC